MESRTIKAEFKSMMQLIIQTERKNFIQQDDRLYVFNRLLALLQLVDYEGTVFSDLDIIAAQTSIAADIPDLLDEIIDQAVERGLIDDLTDERDRLNAEIMDCMMDRPSVINQTFQNFYQQSPDRATKWFYALSQTSNYIQTKRIAKNISYQATTEYGTLDITINLSKPEKNPRDIAAAKNQVSSHYPACLLCPQNEGYEGRAGHPARANHRMIRLTLADEPWYFQYSPYVYYQEHCIVLSEVHSDMVINRKTFSRLLSFVEKFPHYFIGSNADLPIVGGSILTHDHYQGGRYSFAMDQAPVEYTFTLPGYEQVESGLVRWPMSVIRLNAEDKDQLISLADAILSFWRGYDDPTVEVQAFSDDVPHNTVTPIARRRGKRFELDLVLRNNRQNEQHPLGIFHPHEDVHHIKKENIGLIEVMGLAVLPPRLVDELNQVTLFLQNKPAKLAKYHQAWAEALASEYGRNQDATSADKLVKRAVAEKFEQVLIHAGVFKRNDTGRAAFRSFISKLSGWLQQGNAEY